MTPPFTLPYESTFMWKPFYYFHLLCAPKKGWVSHAHPRGRIRASGRGVSNSPGFCRIYLCVVWSERVELSLLLCIFELRHEISAHAKRFIVLKS